MDVELQAGNPVVCVGQTSIQIASHLKDISKRIISTRHGATSSVHGNRSNNKGTVLPNTDVSKGASFLPMYKGSNMEMAVETHVEMLVEQTRAILEEDCATQGSSFSSLRQITMLHGLGECQSVMPVTLMALRDMFPGLSLNTILLVPATGMNGLTALSSLPAAQAALMLSDSVMIRDILDAQMFLSLEMGCGQLSTASSSSGSSSTSQTMKTNLHKFSLDDLQYCIACDIYAALSTTLSPESAYECTLWPYNVCSAGRKLYDVRSSIWRSIKQPNTKAAFHPLRAMSNNIHALHLTSIAMSANHDNFHSQGLECIRAASMLDLRVSRDVYGNSVFIGSPTAVAQTELATSLAWATPHVVWPRILSTHSTLNGSVSRRGTGLSAHQLSKANNDSAGRRLSSASTKSVTSRLSDTADGSSHATAIAGGPANMAMAFDSPYACSFLEHELCRRGADLLAVGAYYHRYVWSVWMIADGGC